MFKSNAWAGNLSNKNPLISQIPTTRTRPSQPHLPLATTASVANPPALLPADGPSPRQ